MQTTSAIMQTGHSGDLHNLKQILDNFPDSVFTIDTELTIQYVNPAFCRLLDYTEEELLGSKITNYLGDLGILEACAVEVAEKGYCNDQETIFIRKDGSRVHISKNVQAIYNKEGACEGNLVSIRDLTNLHHLNTQLEQTVKELRDTQEQLVEAEKLAALGGLVAGVSHEINTPLGISVTAASSLNEQLDKLYAQFRNNELKRSNLEHFFEQSGHASSILQKNIERATELVKNFKQVAVDQSIDEDRDINLHNYCNDVLISLAPKIRTSGITVTNHIKRDIAITINPGAVFQIISNLILNALTHAFEPGQSGRIDIDASIDEKHLNLRVRDNGRGIPKEQQKNIFEPFFTTQRGKGGTGLGLSIVYNTVSGKLNGTIKVASEEGEGSEFTISIPN